MDKGEQKIMSNNTVTLSREIKRELRFLNLKWVFIVFGSIGVVFATGLMVLLAILGLSPNGLLVMMFPTYGSALFISGIAIGNLIGAAVIVAVFRYSTKKVKPYVNIPNELETLKDMVIDLGSYLTTIDEKLPKQVGTIFLYIHREIKSIKETLQKLNIQVEDGNRSRNENERFYINQNLRLCEQHRKDTIEIQNLRKELNQLRLEFEEDKKDRSVKKEQIGEKINAQDINENTKFDDQNKKFERKS